MTKVIQDINLGANIQKYRKAIGMTQNELCAKLDLAGRPMIQTTLAQIESGTRNIFLSDLLVIKNILGITYEQLFENLTPLNKYDRI